MEILVLVMICSGRFSYESRADVAHFHSLGLVTQLDIRVMGASVSKPMILWIPSSYIGTVRPVRSRAGRIWEVSPRGV